MIQIPIKVQLQIRDIIAKHPEINYVPVGMLNQIMEVLTDYIKEREAKNKK